MSSTLENLIDEARGDAARERTELVAQIGADLARLELLDAFLAPGTAPLFHSGRNPLALAGQLGRAAAAPLLPMAGGSRLRRLASRLLTAGG